MDGLRASLERVIVECERALVALDSSGEAAGVSLPEGHPAAPVIGAIQELERTDPRLARRLLRPGVVARLEKQASEAVEKPASGNAL